MSADASHITAVLAAFLCLSFPVSAEEIRFHGLQMDSRHRLVIEQVEGALEASIITRGRAVGGDTTPRVPGAPAAMTRQSQKETLVRARADVLKTAAPNYLRNPGERYRIRLEGVDFLPEFRVDITVDAARAVDQFNIEFEKLVQRASGIQREALRHAGPLILGALNVAGHMPADIPQTVLESSVGRIRGLEERLERRSLPAGRSLNPVKRTYDEPRRTARGERGAAAGTPARE